LSIKLLLKIVVSAAVLVAIFVLLPWADVRTAVARLSPLVWLGVLGGFIAGHRLGVVKWRRLVNAGRASLRSADAVRCYAAGLFANLCLPSIIGGDVLRAALATRATGRAEATVLGSVADRVIDIFGLAVLLAAGGFLTRDLLPDLGSAFIGVGMLVGVLGAMIVLPLVVRTPIRRWPRKLRRPIGRALVALRYLSRDRGVAVLALTISLTMQSGFVLLNWWIGVSIGIDVPVSAWFFAWPLAKLAGLLPVGINGLGVRDATLGALLVPLGVPMASGVVASLVWQSVLICGGLLGGLYWWAASRRRGLPVAVNRRLAVASGNDNG
jgi:uncharacterized membrane protein YbhN (UPF0104 family)